MLGSGDLGANGLCGPVFFGLLNSQTPCEAGFLRLRFIHPNPTGLPALWRYWVNSVINQYNNNIITAIILTNHFPNPASVPVFISLFLLANYTLWTHISALDISKPPDPPT